MNSVALFVKNNPDFSGLSQKEKIKNMIYFLYLEKGTNSFAIKEISDGFTSNDLAVPTNIPRDLSALLKEKPKSIIKKGREYGLEASFIHKMKELYPETDNAVVDVSGSMKAILLKITKDQQRLFLEDAIKCLSVNLYRPAIIMTWLLTMDIIYEYVASNKLVEFNQKLKDRNKKLIISTITDFEDLKESELIIILREINVITKEQKKILEDKLNIRNSAAHPNRTSFKEAKTISFIEELVEDVIVYFQA